MRKPAVYSPSRRPSAAPAVAVASPGTPPAEPAPASRSAWRERLASPRAGWLLSAGLMAVLAGVLVWQASRPAPLQLTQKTIDEAVLRSLSTQVLPSPAARAAEVIRPAVVRVQSYSEPQGGDDDEDGVGTGVVIVDKGVILTNLHVVAGARRIRLTFADGSHSAASIVGAQPENDLAVLQAHTIPDDLVAATMRSTHDLLPGEEVVAVGFPFGIGPSVSAGVVSGLGRSFKAPDGENEVRNLIQFDAAANPGNSGGPLVTMSGEVVGIVTGILNPTQQRTFVGIGFAVPIESAASAAGLPPF
ncbi:S1C family serine protease [uncultured Hydrogenophaga sp.]|uniref:S1C family serine protease n=1 Tax=uncultured Hydrogenophaga sp. TaxID=199683 RepID=UPI00265EC887|nr:trypsin-like peptidase domain-containing protein [uncultured Hydrogenophaga sp.]